MKMNDGKSPLVSILIPVYNRESFIEETIESAKRQTYGNIEIIVGDNCSTDGSWDIICSMAKNDNRIMAFRNSTNLGPVRNWQACLEKASGELCKILFSDDRMLPRFVQDAASLLNDDTAFVISHVRMDYCNGKSIVAFNRYSGLFSSDFFIKNLVIDNGEFSVSPACALFRTKDVRKNLILEIENKDCLEFSKYGAGNDLLIFLLTAKDYEKVKIMDKASIVFSHHKDSLSIKNDLRIYYDYAKLFF